MAQALEPGFVATGTSLDRAVVSSLPKSWANSVIWSSDRPIVRARIEIVSELSAVKSDGMSVSSAK